MADKRFLYDQYGNIAREMVVHETEYGIESFTTVQHEDVSAALDWCKMRRDQGSNKKAHYREAAWIPDTVYLQAFQEGWINDREKWFKWVNDPDNKLLRLDEGQRISGREGGR